MFGISAFAESPFASLQGTFVYVTLTGVSATGSVGTVTHGGAVVALTGVLSSGFAGTMIYNESDATTGDVAIGSVGSVSLVISVALTSVTASGAAGVIDYAQVGFLTTDLASGAVGTVDPVVSMALSGVQATGSVGTVTAVYWKLVDNSESSNWALVETD